MIYQCMYLYVYSQCGKLKGSAGGLTGRGTEFNWETQVGTLRGSVNVNRAKTHLFFLLGSGFGSQEHAEGAIA